MLAFALLRSFLLLAFVLFPLGLGLLRFLEKRLQFSIEPQFQRLSCALVLGSLGNFFLPFLAAVFFPAAFSGLALAQCLISLLMGFLLLRPLGLPRPSRFFLLSSLPLLAIAFASVYVLLGGVVPGSITFDFGDTPSWYRSAQNILQGLLPWDDVWIADYAGNYAIPALSPLPSILVAWQMAVLGFAPYALEIYCLFFGLLGLGLFAEQVRWLTRLDRFSAFSPVFLFLVPGILPVFFFTHPFLILFNGLFLIVSCSSLARIPKYFLLAAVAVFLFAVHPFAAVFLGTLAGAWALHRLAGEKKYSGVFFYSASALVIVLGVLAFSRIAPARFSIFPYLTVNKSGWRTYFDPWEEYSLYLAKGVVGLKQDYAPMNFHVTADIIQNPARFAGFFFQLLAKNVGEVMPVLLVFIALASGLSLTSFSRGARIAVAAAVFYFVLNQCIVLTFRERHFFPALALLGAPAVAALGILLSKRRFGLEACVVLASVWVVFGASTLLTPARVSRQIADQGFFAAADFLIPKLREGDEVVTNQPKGLAFVLSRSLRGGSFLGTERSFTEAFLAKFKARYVVLYGSGALNLKATPSSILGYHLVLDEPAYPLAIFERNNLFGAQGLHYLQALRLQGGK